MKLNARIFVNALNASDILESCRLTEMSTERNIEGYTIYEDGISIDESLLYIVRDPFLLDTFHKNRNREHITVVCLFAQEPGSYEDKWDYLFLKKNVTLNQALEKLEDIVEFYNRWERELSFSLTKVGTISDLCRISLPVFQNPIMVHKWDYEVVGSAQAPGMCFQHSITEPETNYLNESETKELFFRRDYLQAKNFTTPQYWMDDDEIDIYCNIFDEDMEYWGRIVVYGVNGIPTEGHLVLLQVLGEAVKTLAMKNVFHRSGNRELFKQFVLDFFRSPQMFQREKLLNVMQMNGWKQKDRFFCVCAKTSRQRLEMNSIEYECMVFDSHFHNYLAFEWEGKMLLICNLTLSRQSRERECGQLVYIIRENLFKSGISTEFHDFFDFPDYYAQALAALQAGEIHDRTKWMFKFETYALYHILHKGADTLPLKTLVPEYLYRLAAYDRKYGTVLVDTLESYIVNNASTAKALDGLYVHRNTFGSRMKKIREIIKTDIDSYERKVYLMILFRILKVNPQLLSETGEEYED